jgi:DNA-binding transcriptional regulator LsrR (DeoR family)
MAKVAWLYHNRGMRQHEIAARLDISQSRVSRLLDQAAGVGIIRTTVVMPEGLHAELEEQLEHRYGLREAHIFDVAAAAEDEEDLITGLGLSLAARLQAHPFEAEASA